MASQLCRALYREVSTLPYLGEYVDTLTSMKLWNFDLVQLRDHASLWSRIVQLDNHYAWLLRNSAWTLRPFILPQEQAVHPDLRGHSSMLHSPSRKIEPNH